ARTISEPEHIGHSEQPLPLLKFPRRPNATRQALAIAGAKNERRLLPVACTRRLCQNPVFGACGLCKPLILLNRIFEKSTFDTVSAIVRHGLDVQLWSLVSLLSFLFVDSRLVGGLRNNFQSRTICQAVNVEIMIQGKQAPHT